MASGKMELFFIVFLAGLVFIPLTDYVYNMIGPKLGLPTISNI